MKNNHTDATITYFDKGYWLNDQDEIDRRSRTVRKFLDNIVGKSILDIGCGDGKISLQYQKNNELLLMDISANMLEAARKKVGNHASDNIRFIQADFMEYELLEKFDIIICIGVLAHVRSVDKMLKKISLHLNDDGICVIQYTNTGNIIGWLNRQYYNIKGRLKRSRNYKLNKINTKSIEKICKNYSFHILDKAQYISTIPILDRLLLFFGKKTEKKFYSRINCKLLSPEIIFFLKKG